MVPQAPPGLPLIVNVTESPATANPPKLVTVAVTVWVLEPVAAIAAVPGAMATKFGGAVCVMVVELLRPELASVAVTVQGAAVPDAVYVVMALPVLPVVTVLGVRLPQAVPEDVNATKSPETAPPLAVVTVAVTVEVLEPSAGTLEGLAVTLITDGPPLAV
jgi:hypothetical protein